MNLGLRHIRARRQITKRLEPFPTRGPRKYYDYLMFGVGFVMPAALLPQVASVYVDHSTAGVSLVTWSLLTFFNVLWTIYGILHKDVPIIFANVFLFLFDFAIVVGVLLYA